MTLQNLQYACSLSGCFYFPVNIFTLILRTHTVTPVDATYSNDSAAS